MKKIILCTIFIVTVIFGFSQSADKTNQNNFSSVIDVFNDIYLNVPDSVKGRFFNPGISFSGFFEHHFKNSNFSVAIGAGIGSHNFYSNSFVVTDTNGITGLRPIKNIYPNNSYKKNKISYTYLDFPVEVRMRAKNDIRAAIGFKVGLLLDSHSKDKGLDYLSGTKKSLFIKTKDINDIEKLRYGVSTRFGWKFINVTGFYSLSNLFAKDLGPELYPISFGISLMPF